MFTNVQFALACATYDRIREAKANKKTMTMIQTCESISLVCISNTVCRPSFFHLYYTSTFVQYI